MAPSMGTLITARALAGMGGGGSVSPFISLVLPCLTEFSCNGRVMTGFSSHSFHSSALTPRCPVASIAVSDFVPLSVSEMKCARYSLPYPYMQKTAWTLSGNGKYVRSFLCSYDPPAEFHCQIIRIRSEPRWSCRRMGERHFWMVRFHVCSWLRIRSTHLRFRRAAFYMQVWYSQVQSRHCTNKTQSPVLLFSFLVVAAKVNIQLPSDVQNQCLSDKLRRIDVMGTLTLVGMVGCLLLGFSLKTAEELPWSHPLVYNLFIASFIFMILFLLAEKYWAPYPVMPLHLMTQRTPLAVSISNLLASMTAFSMVREFLRARELV